MYNVTVINKHKQKPLLASALPICATKRDLAKTLLDCLQVQLASLMVFSVTKSDAREGEGRQAGRQSPRNQICNLVQITFKWKLQNSKCQQQKERLFSFIIKHIFNIYLSCLCLPLPRVAVLTLCPKTSQPSNPLPPQFPWTLNSPPTLPN